MFIRRIYFLFFFLSSSFVFGEDFSSIGIKQKRTFLKASFQTKPSVQSLRVVTKNKKLYKALNKYLKKRTISKKAIQEFLINNSYYQSEVIKTESNYLIKNPIQTIFILRGNIFFSEKDILRFAKINENNMGGFFYDFFETAVKSAYQGEGFLKIKIDKRVVKKKWKEWIYLNISEGPRIRIAELKIKGLLSKPSSYYENFIKNNSTDLIRKGFYSKKDLEIGYENLINYLKSQGYLQSKIYSDRIFFKEDKAFVTINLEEGALTIIRGIQIKKSKAFPIWEILSHIQSKIHSALKVDVLIKDLDKIEQLYRSKGYLYMRIVNKDNVIQHIPGERYASIIIHVEEGPKVFVSQVSVQGLKKTKENLVRGLLRIKAGDVLTPLKKEQSVKNLGATGLFTNISLSERVDGTQFEVLARFKERKLRTLRGGFGLNSQRGITTRAYSEVAHRNLFGWGRAFIVRGSGQVSFTRQRDFLEYELSGRYKEVFIPSYFYQGDVNFTQSRSVFSYSQEEVNFVDKTQISFFINKELNKNLKFHWNVWSFENRREHCLPVFCQGNIQKIGNMGFNMIWDKRNNIFDPSQGHLSSFLAEWSSPFLGSSSEISFVKADLHNQWYGTFLKDYTVGLTIKAGLIYAVQDSRYIPVSRAFILGGQNSVRAYDGNIEGERIPSEKYAPIKTANEALQLKTENIIERVLLSRYGLMNLDFRFPIFKGFKGGFFYDLAFVYLKGQNEEILHYGHSAGFGFRYQTFIIPIGLDIAYKLPPKEGLDYRFHFSIGW